ncbi:uncharacterized protein LOC144441494 [Glandiceps talaboti]
MPFTPSPCKQRLVSLMGSDEVKVNDKRYMQKLKKRLDEDYQIKLRKRQEALALNEVKREKRLILEGIISRPIDEIERDKARQRAPHRRKKKRKHSKGSQDGTQSAENPDESRPGSICGPSNHRHSCCHGNTYENASSSEDDTQLSQEDETNDEDEDIEEKCRSGKSKRELTDPVLCNLMEEESVSGLYSLAERLVTK